jgi:hypothetical protein
LIPVVDVGASEELPVGLLVRALVVVWLDLGYEARAAGGAELEATLAAGTALPGFLPPAGLREVGRGAAELDHERLGVDAFEE